MLHHACFNECPNDIETFVLGKYNLANKRRTVEFKAVKKVRLKLPTAVEHQLMYASASTCCVCREPGSPVEIHHIDQNPSNNEEENLIVICRNCHSDAHTKRQLAKNLTPELLRSHKAEWQREVSTRSASAMLPANNMDQAMWTFINHLRLPEILKSYDISLEKRKLKSLVAQKVVDHDGIPRYKKDRNSDRISTIYDSFDYHQSHSLHLMYREAVDRLILKSSPIELGAIWSKRAIKVLVQPGCICYCIRGFSFKRGEVVDGEEDRAVHAKAHGIEIKFISNTRHMFGSSALWDSFSGTRSTAALLLIKDLSSENGVLTLRATPLAMGAGFIPFEYKSPHNLKYGWVNPSPLPRERHVWQI